MLADPFVQDGNRTGRVDWASHPLTQMLMTKHARPRMLLAAREIDRALTALEDAGRMQRKDQADGRGRPTDFWVPLSRAA